MKTRSIYVPDIDTAKLANAKARFLFITCPLTIKKCRFTYRV